MFQSEKRAANNINVGVGTLRCLVPAFLLGLTLRSHQVRTVRCTLKPLRGCSAAQIPRAALADRVRQSSNDRRHPGKRHAPLSGQESEPGKVQVVIAKFDCPAPGALNQRHPQLYSVRCGFRLHSPGPPYMCSPHRRGAARIVLGVVFNPLVIPAEAGIRNIAQRMKPFLKGRAKLPCSGCPRRGAQGLQLLSQASTLKIAWKWSRGGRRFRLCW